MAINSSSNLRFSKPGFMKTDAEKIQPRIEKFLKACASKNLLTSPQQKIAYAKFLMDRWKMAIPDDYLSQVFGAQLAEHLTLALEHEIQKFKSFGGPDQFRESLEAHLLEAVFGKDETRRFYLLHMAETIPHRRLKLLEEKFQSLHSPTLQSRSVAPQPHSSPQLSGTPFPSTQPVFSTHDDSPKSHRSADDDSWAACDAQSTASSFLDEPSTIYRQSPQSRTAVHSSEPKKSQAENEKG